MKIGIISDTHGVLPGSVLDIFKGVDQIFHAGDIGNQDVIQGLEIIAPVSAVYGNVSYEMFRGISYINPGSAVKPRGRKFGTVGILDLADINLRPEIIEIKNGS